MDNPSLVKAMLDKDLIDDEDRAHFRIGSAVDTLLTNTSEFNKLFYINGLGRPSGLTGIFLDSISLDLHEDSPLEAYSEAYMKAGFNMPIDRVVKSLWTNEKYRDYFMARKQSLDKTILSNQEYEIVLSSQMSILNNAFARDYFFPMSSYLEVFTQVPLYFTYRGLPLKGLMDGMLVNHKEKTITPYDLKTTGRSVLEFPSTFISFKYYGQASLYFQGLKQLIQEGNFYPSDDFDYQLKIKDYHVNNFLFIVSEKAPIQRSPVSWIFRCTDQDLEAGLRGGTYNGRPIKGIDQMIDEFLWHRENNYWSLPKTALDNQGIINLDALQTLNDVGI